MNILPSIRRSILPQRSHDHDAGSYKEIVRRLDVLTSNQNKVAQAIEDLSTQQRRMQPTMHTWTIALLIFLSSVAIICFATSGIVHISLITGQADTLHRQAQADRTQAIEQIVETLAPFDQAVTLGSRSQRVNSQLPLKADRTVLSVIRNADNLLREADSTDAQADTLDTSTAFKSYLAEIILVIGSAIAGGVVSWVITQWLVNKRQRPARVGPQTG